MTLSYLDTFTIETRAEGQIIASEVPAQELAAKIDELSGRTIGGYIVRQLRNKENGRIFVAVRGKSSGFIVRVDDRCPTCKSADKDCPGPGWIASGCSDDWHWS